MPATSRRIPRSGLSRATDLDRARAAAFAEEHGVDAYDSLEELLADDRIDIILNLTVHHAHFAVTKQALEAGRHVYSEKPLALSASEARELVALAKAQGVRLGGSPSTFLGEAQQTAAALIRNGRLGTVRAIYADVNWGRIETWHPAPAPFFDVGVLVDVGVYPLTLVTTMLGPARSVRAWGWELKPERTTLAGSPFRIGSPDLIVAAVELASGPVVRLTASFYVGRPAKARGSLEFHGDDASLAISSFQVFDATVEVGPFGGEFEPVELVRPPFEGTAWARGVAEMAAAIGEGRPHRASGEQAAHVVEILEAAAQSMAAGGREIAISSTIEPPPLMPWAEAEVRRVAFRTAVRGAPRFQRALPVAIQRSNRSTCDRSHRMSHGMEPSLTRPRIPSAFSLTSSYDQRSNANSINSRSRSRNIGLISVSKLTASPAFALMRRSFVTAAKRAYSGR